MELLGDPFEKEQRIGNFIRNVPTTLQVWPKYMPYLRECRIKCLYNIPGTGDKGFKDVRAGCWNIWK